MFTMFDERPRINTYVKTASVLKLFKFPVCNNYHISLRTYVHKTDFIKMTFFYHHVSNVNHYFRSQFFPDLSYYKLLALKLKKKL